MPIAILEIGICLDREPRLMLCDRVLSPSRKAAGISSALPRAELFAGLDRSELLNCCSLLRLY